MAERSGLLNRRTSNRTQGSNPCVSDDLKSMNKQQILDKVSILLKYLKTNEAMKIVAALPLFFSWVPIYTWNHKNSQFVEICFTSAVNTCLLFFGFLILQILSFIPFIGLYLASILHLVLILLYLGISGFLIYSIRLKKTIEIPIVSEWVNKLIALIAPIAQLDRVSDYGSEG